MNIDEPLRPELMLAFKRSVEKHFSGVAQAVDSQLLRLSPSLYGFRSEYAIVTVGVYHGHSPGLCVKLRHRRDGDLLDVYDGKDIGLANVVLYSDPSVPLELGPQQSWTEESLDTELQKLATTLLRYGRPFLTDPDADWNGLREWVDKRAQKAVDELLEKYPWLKR